jgi:hypothetical protein
MGLGISVLNRITFTLFFIISGLLAQENNSFNFQSNEGGEDFVRISTDPQNQPTSGMTLEAWVKPTENPEAYEMNGIVSYLTLQSETIESGYGLLYNSGKWRFVVITANDQDVYPQIASWPGIEIPYDGNTWTHIAGTYDGAVARIFKNGVEQDSYNTPGGAIVWEDIDTDLFIGKYIDASTAFKGSIDEVRIWEMANTESEIQSSMNTVLDTDQSGLIGYWNFNDNQNTEILSHVNGGTPGILNDEGLGDWDTDVFAGASGGCFDTEIIDSDFPYNHLADLTIEDNDWNFNTFYYSGGGGHDNFADGNDHTYKLTLTEPANIYITTCDSETNVDVQIAIYSDCDTTSWLLFQDDSNTPIYYPDQTDETYEFSCISGFESAPTYANMLPLLEWDAGTYYIVVDDRNGGNGTVRTWFGYSLVVDSTTTSDDYSEINYHFSEGVYGGEYADVYNGNGIALEAGDYNLEINPNGGDADEAYITSLTTLAGGTLSPAAEDVKININYPDTPSGSEIVTIGPESVSSIFNSVGIPLLDVDGITIELVDALAPTVEFSSPENDQEDIPTTANIELTFSEQIRHSDNSDITNSNSDDCFLLENVGTGESIDFTITSSDNISFTLNPDGGLPEYEYIRLTMQTVIEDRNDNSFSLETLVFRTADETPPTIQSSSISSINDYVMISFNEGIFSTNSGGGALTLEDITYSFNSNGGNCETLVVTGLSDQNGSSLVGGETVIRALLQLGGSPGGVETIVLGPSNDASIFDLYGNPMSSSAETDPVTLLASAYIESYSLADSNEFIDLSFSVGVYGNSIQTQPVILSSFSVALNSNGGNTTSATPINLTSTNNSELSGGESVLRLYLSYNDLPSGEEEIVISPTPLSATNFSIYSLSGIPVPVTEVSDSILLNDQNPPSGDISMEDGASDIYEGDSLSLDFSENIYLPETGEEATIADLIPFITLKIGDSTGTNIPFTIEMDGDPPTITIVPLEPYPSESVIYYSFEAILQDENENYIVISNEATFSIRDYIPPSVSSSVLAFNNSYIDIIFDDELYGNNDETGMIQSDDIIITVIPNGSNVDTCIITSITLTDSNFLNGGESNIRVNLEYNNTPDGNEFLILEPNENATLYDESGNQFISTTYIDTIQFSEGQIPLNDILPPSIDNISIPIDSFIVLMESTPIIFSFNEKVDSLIFSVTGTVADSVNFDSTRLDSSLEIILQPPFTSFDSITVNFSYLEDESGLTTVDIAYTYVTPMLGDYDLDSVITYYDLWDLVENWELKNYNYELGPVTGSAPHFVSYPDSKFDIEDGMSFVRMWSWYQNTFGEINQDTVQAGRHLEMINDQGQLLIIIGDSITSGQISFSYDPGISPVKFSTRPSKKNEIFINENFPGKGFSILEFARSENFNTDTLNVIIDKTSQFTLSYSLSNSERRIVQKGSVKINQKQIPTQVTLYPAYPNPFNPATTVRFDIPEIGNRETVSLIIYDIQGREVERLVDGPLLPGTYQIPWRPIRTASGMYFSRLIFGNKTKTQKLLFLK